MPDDNYLQKDNVLTAYIGYMFSALLPFNFPSREALVLLKRPFTVSLRPKIAKTAAANLSLAVILPLKKISTIRQRVQDI